MSESREGPQQRSATPLVAGLVGGAFALGGVLPMPYGYYSAMRLVIVTTCVVLAGAALVRRRPVAVAPILICALFFLLVRGLPKDVWRAIDLASGVGLITIGAWLSRLPVRA